MSALPATCTSCGTGLAVSLKVCPGCGVLVHREQLRALQASAVAQEQAGDLAGALVAWRTALELVPRDSAHFVSLAAKVSALSEKTDAVPAKTALPRWAASLGVLGLVLWKAKWLLALVATKAKFLLLGLTKAKTVLSMLFAGAAYLTLWGWRFAVGVILTTYVHEMGHVAALRRRGVRATAPMFVPGFGAFIRAEQPLVSAQESARVGIAGPVWGMLATFVCWAMYGVTGNPLLGAIARFSAWVNLFNLVPVWQLDGARVFGALTRVDRIVIALLVAGCAYWVGDILIVLAVVTAARAWFGPFPATSDRRSWASYIVVLLTLTACIAFTEAVTKYAGAS